MAKDNSNSCNSNSPLLREPGSNKSFVKKVRSRMSGLLPTSLSKWFSKESDSNKPTVRPREEDDDDDYYNIQPPTKRVKMPSPTTNLHNNRHTNSISPTTFNINDTSRLSSAITGDKQINFRSTLPDSSVGPSGIKSKELFSSTIHYNNLTENLVNGDRDSESGESVSGHSSSARISHKDLLNAEESKKIKLSTPNVNPNSLFNSSFGGHSRSLFTERSLSPQINSSLSSRRPSFNASTFGSPNFIDRTLFTKRIINSPFYNGRTTYGGASAYDPRKGRSPNDIRASIKSQIQVKPVNQSIISDNATLSKTARRILDTLEQYATPISDAKKIPNPLSKRLRHEGLLSKYAGANPYLLREHKTPSASNKELQIPTVPDLLKMKLKERLQDSTVAVRQIATTSKSSLNCDEYKIKNVEETPKYVNKMKTKISSIRQKPDTEMVEELKLPDIALPITTLPKFDFSLAPPPSCSKPLVTVACSDNKPTKVSESTGESQKVMVIAEPKKSNPETIEYTFSNPLVLAENLVSIIAINDFKFSDPVCKQRDNKTMPEITLPKSSSACSFVNFKAPDEVNISKPSEVMSLNFKSPDTSNMILKKKTQDNSDVIKPGAQLLTGSIDEIFSKKAEKEKPQSTTNLLDKFKPAAGTWECSSCLLRNTPDKVTCAACETPKEKKEDTSKPTATGFGKEFKMSSGNWECQECLVRNESSVTKCVACTAPKPGLASASKPGSSIAPPPLNGPAPSSFKWGDQFKPPSSTWECPTCMIRNKDETEKCVACETPKPGGISKSNKSSTAESASKPTETKEPTQVFNFGFFPNATANLTQTTHNTTKSEVTKPSTTISSIFGQNSTSSTVMTTTTSSIPTFTFGIPSKNLENKEVVEEKKEVTKEIIFKAPEKLPEKTETTTTTTTTSTVSGFVFGNAAIKPAEVTQPINTTQSQPEEKPKQTTIPTNFAFGTTNNVSQPANQPDNNTKADSTSHKPVTIPTTSTPLPGFTFVASASPSLKHPSNDNDLQSSISAKKDAPTLPAAPPIIFSPPKQPLINKADSNILNKPSLPLSNGNSNKVDNNNLFATITPAPAPTQTVPSNSFTFTPTQTQSVLPSTSTTTNLFNFGAKTTSMPIFGNTTTTTTTTAESSIFKFAPSSKTPSNNQPGFGNISIQPTTNNLFGNSNATSSVFGAVTKPAFETPAVSPANAFGTTASSTFPAPTSEIKPFAFGSATNETLSQPKTSGFSFGQTTKPTEPAKPVFNFGAPVSSSAPTGGGFSFNTNTNTAAPSMNFNFNPPKMDNASPFQTPTVPASNIFSPQNPVQPAQPQPLQNGGFNFGGAPANNNTKTGFNFGVSATPPQFNQPQPPMASSGVFSFGAPNPNPAPATGGFNFNAAVPAFNANIKPTFNFTGGNTPSFSAQPTESPGVAQRKKIRAVRRQR